MIGQYHKFVLEITQPYRALLCQAMFRVNDGAEWKWHGDDVSYPAVRRTLKGHADIRCSIYQSRNNVCGTSKVAVKANSWKTIF